MTDNKSKTIARMGYPNMIDAISFGDDDHDLIEIGLIGPNSEMNSHQNSWSVAIHFATDPDQPELGASELNLQPNLEEARIAYNSAIAEYKDHTSETTTFQVP